MIEMSEEQRARLAELVYRFPPLRIENGEQLEATQAVVDGMLDREHDSAEEAYLDLLGGRISEWEDEHEDWPDLPGAEMIKVLLEDRELHQHDLVVGGVFATDSVASEVLNGRRAFRLEHVIGAARFFNLPAEIFMSTASAPTDPHRTAQPA